MSIIINTHSRGGARGARKKEECVIYTKMQRKRAGATDVR